MIILSGNGMYKTFPSDIISNSRINYIYLSVPTTSQSRPLLAGYWSTIPDSSCAAIVDHVVKNITEAIRSQNRS